MLPSLTQITRISETLFLPGLILEMREAIQTATPPKEYSKMVRMMDDGTKRHSQDSGNSM